ncbi:L-lysine 6-transaminase [Engelhardtia mirabilis]|uniref:L-lysine 6-transaminase n=1 Tax=Engelhardtia mirabilis TaxID=2528011 RepID=UPI0011A0D80E
MRPTDVHEHLARHQLADGFPMVLDLEKSHGVWLRDSVSGNEYLDCFTSFASWPLGYRHPGLDDRAFRDELLEAALNKPANSDLYTTSMAEFVDAFASRVTPASHPHHFWISGGGLAVENAMKTAFDWKARKLGRTKMTDSVQDLVILHFRQAFHGRTGYTMSVTNTLPDKVGLFPKFDWPRVHNPAMVVDNQGKIVNDIEAEEARACAEIEAAFAQSGQHVAAILIEPIQGEGGDNYFRPEFLRKLRAYADEREALLIFDEVQTGFFGTGSPWCWQIYGVEPDVVAFGKKTQVCGIYANRRVDEVEDNVFHRSSRINSTWGGNLVDMVRCRRFIEIIEADGLGENTAARGCQVVGGLRAVAAETGAFSNVRGMGSWVAFTFEDGPTRSQFLARLRDEVKMLALPSGTSSVRLRMPLILSESEGDEVIGRIRATAEKGAKAPA